jgi:hypothetical protein
MKMITFSLVALFAVQLSIKAQEENFTFRIPVELHLIPPDIKTFAVSVEVYDKEVYYNGSYTSSTGERIGYGDVSLPIINGEFMDTVVIKFNAQVRKDPATAVGWAAYLLLYGPPGYQGGVMTAMGPDTPYPYDSTKPLVYLLIGRIGQTSQLDQVKVVIPPKNLERSRIKKIPIK